jgi:hypothetical protein
MRIGNAFSGWGRHGSRTQAEHPPAWRARMCDESAKLKGGRWNCERSERASRFITRF